MGYQKVTATLDDGSIANGLVFNGELFVEDTDDALPTVHEKWSAAVDQARKSAPSIKSVQVISRSPDMLRGVKRVVLANARRTLSAESYDVISKSAEGPAKDGRRNAHGPHEVFKRFSAYKNDRRVTNKQGLTPGTFATTREDAELFVKTGTDAVHRYALENKAPASNVFTIVPPRKTNLKRGIAQPAYGEPGGGVEVIFVNGSPDGTVRGPETIPDK